MAKKILYIEDEIYISEIYARSLSKIGYEVTLVKDGKKGLEMAQTNQYDIVLLDLMLPSLPGVEILKILRDPKQSPNFHSRIIITTNLAERRSVQAEIERQADGYFIKASTTPKQLAEFIKQVNIAGTDTPKPAN
ncbi:MAG TPA: response regulator [Candidatus Saccharimonadales bacterium]|nr:response regulator [Candidatus Saccharimonadales bacterium]